MDNIKIVKKVYKNITMIIDGITDVIKLTDNQKFSDLLKRRHGEYQNYLDSLNSLLTEKNEKAEDYNFAEKTWMKGLFKIKTVINSKTPNLAEIILSYIHTANI